MRKVSPTVAEIETLRASAPAGLAVIINLLKFRPDGGRAVYMQYRRESYRAMETAGLAKPKVLYTGSAGADVADGQSWDHVAVVEYLSFDHFADLIVDPAYQQKAIPLREKALENALFLVTFPADPLME